MQTARKAIRAYVIREAQREKQRLASPCNPSARFGVRLSARAPESA